MKLNNIAIKALVFFFLFSLQNQAFAQSGHNICVASLNSKNEEQVFKDYVNSQKRNGKETGIEFTNLIKKHDPDIIENKDPNAKPNDWFKEACDSGVQCDILLVSAHFAESFFGSRTGLTLGLDEMEKRSCQETCDGLLKKPKEVFLMGCNTLADKSKSTNGRTFDSYVNDLTGDVLNNSTGDKIPLDVAERIAMARYGPFGGSFKDRMRSVFGGTSQLYGFDDLGPSGASVEKYLQSYLDDIGSKSGGLEAHLNKRDAVELIELEQKVESAIAKMNNPTLTAHLDPNGNGFTDFEQCSGLNKSDPEYAMKENICNLHKEEHLLSDRLEHGLNLLQQDDYEKYLPSVTSFIKENYNQLSTNDRSVRLLNKLAKNKKLKDTLSKALDQLRFKGDDGLPANQLDIFITQKLLGHLSDEQLELETKKLLKKQFKNLNGSNHQLVCTLKNTGVLTMTAHYGMFNPSDLSTPDGVRAMGCFQTKDINITKEAMKAFDKSATEKELTHLLMGASHLPKNATQKDKLNKFANGLINHANPSVSAPAHRLILRTGNSQEVSSSLKTLLKNKVHTNYITSFAIENPQIKNESYGNEVSALALSLLKEEQAKSPKTSQYSLELAKSFAHLTPENSNNWQGLNRSNKSEIAINHLVLREAAKLEINNTHLSDLAIDLASYDVRVAKHNAKIRKENVILRQQNKNEKTEVGYYSTGHTSYLRNAKLSKKQYEKLYGIFGDLKSAPNVVENREHWRLQLYRSVLNSQSQSSKKISGKSGNIRCRTVNTYQTLCM